jgi:hypothetical protein
VIPIHTEVWFAAGYSAFLVLCALGIEWLSAHTSRRALRWRTAGFTYDALHDRWWCPEGQDLWPHEFDDERRLVRYRAKPHICNRCPRKPDCTDSDRGREIVRPLDPWPHSEAGRFHRGLSLVLIVLAALIALLETARHHTAIEVVLLALLLGVTGLVGRLLLRDFRRHPSGFPASAPAHGLRLTMAPPADARARSRWGSQNRGRRS